MSKAPSPQKKTLSDLKATILRPALTSNFQCWFNPPPDVRDWVQSRISAGIGNGYDSDLISLSCSEASLPGSSLATHEINNDFTGVTERHAYRRQYDDRADFTFYVDHDYNVLQFFENWMSYIVGEEISGGVLNNNFSYRVRFPGTEDSNGYKSTIYIKKFEKDYAGRVLQYRFLNAYPISINSMPVSYDSSQLLKCTVSFNYSRYVIGGGEVMAPPQESQTPAEQAANIAPGNPGFSGTDGEEYYGQLPPVESGLPYVGRNRGPLAPFFGI
jgi:hypothetical protein